MVFFLTMEMEQQIPNETTQDFKRMVGPLLQDFRQLMSQLQNLIYL